MNPTGSDRTWSFRGWVTATQTLTRIPIPLRGTANFSDALPWFPLVGFVIAALWLLPLQWLHAWQPSLWPVGVAILWTAAGVWTTGALHLDGFADWADALGAGPDRVRALRILKDPHLGVYGTLALILNLGWRTACLTQLWTVGRMEVWMTALILSRTAQVVLAVRLPYARDSGGTAAPFVQGARFVHAGIALVWSAGLTIMISGNNPVMLGIAWSLAGAMTAVFGRHCHRRFGGVTGDLLGAVSEWVELGVLAAAVFCF